KKIKDSILRRDSNLSDVSSKMRQVMAAGIMVNGKTMYLSDFGIGTLGYFSAPDNEKNAYHIDGDPDDGDTSGNADKLKSMIANDPDTVISFFTKLSQNLYGKMSDMSKSINGYRSFGSFYDDKKMKSDYDNYASKIKEQETKLNAYEDKWYKKFAKMETALAKMQKNATAVTGLLGGQ
ncbi:MAG: flagellar filament capping protein FliD, partial [Acetatifactor sp.]|nr:flagellar filament capping protein FliD [Acetatifactor sp.]